MKVKNVRELCGKFGITSPLFTKYRKLNVNFTYFLVCRFRKIYESRISNMNFTKNDPSFTKNLHLKSRKVYQLILGYFS